MVQNTLHTQPLTNNPGETPMPERANPEIFVAPWQLRLFIDGNNAKPVTMKVKERMVIGRADPDARNPLDLDLSGYGGLQSGVSRLHAVITYQDEALYVEDLGSTNGTRINGFRLTPNRAYRLRSGDELEFGRVSVVLRFVNT
jgi:pSer/pThr/pTyr-binding forkhead associated (FHA) protein